MKKIKLSLLILAAVFAKVWEKFAQSRRALHVLAFSFPVPHCVSDNISKR